MDELKKNNEENEEMETIDETKIKDHGPLPEVIVRDSGYKKVRVRDGDDN